MDNRHRRWSLLLDREIEPATKGSIHSGGKLVQVGRERRCFDPFRTPHHGVL